VLLINETIELSLLVKFDKSIFTMVINGALLSFPSRYAAMKDQEYHSDVKLLG
jgi:hypothetical protein